MVVSGAPLLRCMMARFAAMPERNPAIVQAYATASSRMNEMVGDFDIH